MSMNFPRLVGAEFLATCIVAWLSIHSGVGWGSGKPMSLRTRRIQCVCCVAVEAAKYSASQVELATVVCLDEVQPMGHSCMIWIIPVLDFRSGSLAKSESA